MTATRRTIGVLVLVTLAGPFAPRAGWAAPAEIAGAPLVYLRTGPGPTHQPVGVLSEGTRLETLGVEGAWTHVRVEDGREGFVYTTFVEISADPGPTPTGAPQPAPPAAGGEPPLAPGGALSADPPPPTPDPFLLEEVARLRTEIDSLKRTVKDELTMNVAEGADPAAADESAEPGLQILGVGLVCLVIGWFLGTAFTRRRSQRSRLRF